MPNESSGDAPGPSVDVAMRNAKSVPGLLKYAKPVTEVLNQPNLFNERAKETCERLKGDTNYRGAYEFGTIGGDDLDMRLCYTKLPSELEQERIRSQFQDLGVKADVLFIEEDEIRNGKIADLKQFANAEAHLKYGFDPHYKQAAVGDTSLFSLYIFATMRPFQQDKDRPLLPTKDALDKLKINREGAIGWTHYYTGCFLGEFAQYKKGELPEADYQKRLAKFFSRVTLGSTLAQLDQTQLDAIQPLLVDAIQSAGKNNSTDEKMIEVLLGNQAVQKILSEDSKQLLTIAGQIRSGQTEDMTKEFLQKFTNQAESMLFYNASQQGIERRLEPGQDVDYVTSYAFEMLGRNPELRTKLAKYPEGHVFFNQGDESKDVYYIPLGQAENPGVKIVVEGLSKPYFRTPGRTFGELALFNQLRSATVISQQNDTEVRKFDAQIIRDLLSSKTIYEELKQPVLQTDAARTADVLLEILAREGISFLGQTLPYTTNPHPETPERLLENNPFAQYYLGEAFHEIMAGFIREGDEDSPVTRIKADNAEKILFEQGIKNDKIYVVSKGPVTIRLQNGEPITHQKDAVIGESSMRGTKTTGKATISEDAEVLAIDAKWFQQFTQSRKKEDLPSVPDAVAGILPRHLMYHLAAIGYGRINNRIATQVHPTKSSAQN